MKKITNLIYSFFMVLVLTACSADLSSVTSSVPSADKDTYRESTASQPADNKEVQESVQDGSIQPEAVSTNITIEDIPSFSGSPYVAINSNQPDFSDTDKKITDAFEFYSELDSLGRCGQAYANICPELMPQEERGAIGQVKPSGWHTVKYNDLIDGNYLYNRCHLIGYQLAGENANVRNLITGTRYLNVTGMLPFENEVADYVNRTGNHVLYRVTPVFDGGNLVASGVEMEAWSVEDNGAGICFHIYCYNVQPGIVIDYATGDSTRADEAGEQEQTQTQSQAQSSTAGIQTQEQTARSGQNQAAQQEQSQSQPQSEQNVQTYIINTNTGKYHVPQCSSVAMMKEENKKQFEGTSQDLQAQGYQPCKRCIGN